VVDLIIVCGMGLSLSFRGEEIYMAAEYSFLELNRCFCGIMNTGYWWGNPFGKSSKSRGKEFDGVKNEGDCESHSSLLRPSFPWILIIAARLSAVDVGEFLEPWSKGWKIIKV